jgi:hypothetical protein
MHFTNITSVLSVTVGAALAHGQTLIGSMSGNAFEHFGTATIYAGFQDADTYADLLVGAYNSGNGAIRCVSGRYLATGAGPSLLWSLSSPTINPAQFGVSIADVGNLTGNSASDFVVGAPSARLNPFNGINNGAVFLVDGSTHAIAAAIYGFDNTALGSVVVSVGDQDGDGKAEVAVTAPSTNGSASQVHVISGSAFVGTTSIGTAAHWSYSNGTSDFGDTLASGFDLDGDGKRDLAIGSPRMFSGNGSMLVVSAANNFTTLASYFGSAGEHMGASISASHDYNGDGVVDFVVGAPLKQVGLGFEVGRAVVLSGAKLRAFTPPYELADLANPIYPVFDQHFGACVRASPDLNRDGVGDFLVGGPVLNSTGTVVVYSGATLTKLASIVGNSQDHLGDSILGVLQDVTGDLFPEFVVAGTNSDNPIGACGVIKLYSLFPTVPFIYCPAKINSLGCLPAVGWSGLPSATSASPFSITCSNVLNQKMGLLVYSHAPDAAPFQGGTLCVKPPQVRTLPQSSGGNASGSDCTGIYSVDFNARIQSGVDPTLVAGSQTFAQFWSRDPASPSLTGLSNALRFVINP